MKALFVHDLRTASALTILILALCARALSSQSHTGVVVVRVPARHQADVWTGINVTGKVFISIRTRSGSDAGKFWWVTWGVGSTRQIGELRRVAVIDSPISWWKGIVSAKLRVEATEDTVIEVSDRVAVDYQKTFEW